MSNRIAVIEGVRTPMGKYGGALAKTQADDLAAHTIREVINRSGFNPNQIDEVIFGNVGGPAHAMNISRVAAIKAGLNKQIPAFTVHRNCASGMESVSNAIIRILQGQGNYYLAGGTESMSNIPLLFKPKAKAWFEKLGSAKKPLDKIKTILGFRPGMIAPVIALKLGLSDVTCGMIMGDTAEVLAKEFGITRAEQDEFAALSHNRAEKATEDGILAQEIAPIVADYKKGKILEKDEGIRYDQTTEKLAKLRPYFDRRNGTVTAGNSSQITDGASCLLLCSEAEAKKQGIKPLGYIKDFAYAGLDPHRMGLGPVFATAKLLKRHKQELKEFDLIEINEAFATQVIACERAFNSAKFCKDELSLTKKIGEVNRNILNVNGGAVALGHPVGMTGNRLILTMLKELKRRKKQTALASLCIGGGQGGAFMLESA